MSLTTKEWFALKATHPDKPAFERWYAAATTGPGMVLIEASSEEDARNLISHIGSRRTTVHPVNGNAG